MGLMDQTSSASVGPRNIQFMLNRLSAYSKNTIRLQPQTKSTYAPSDSIAFRLPASALLDLHTATLQFKMTFSDGRVVDAVAAGNPTDRGMAAPPRFNGALFKRVDVQMGSTSVGLTGLHDYGALYTLLAHHTIHQDRASMDLGWVEGGPYLPWSTSSDEVLRGGLPGGGAITDSGIQVGRSRWQLQKGQTREDWLQVRNFLGLLGGQYMRFMDTNILPEVTLYFQLAPKQVVASTDITRLDWKIDNVSLSFESVNFGDGTYRALVDRRLATSDIVIPFSNWVGFEGAQTSAGSSITQFTVASKSLNGLIGTMRRGDYDAQPNSTTGNGQYDTRNTLIRLSSHNLQVSSPGTKYYQFFCGRDPVGLDFAETDKVPNGQNRFNYGYPIPIHATPQATDNNTPYALERPTDEIYDMYGWRGGDVPAAFPRVDPAANPPPQSVPYPVPNYWLSNRKKSTLENRTYANSVNGSPRYQFTVDSKLYPQFTADVVDAAQLTKNYFDAGAMNMAYGSTVPSLKEYLNHAFMFPVGLDHHSDSAKSDNLVSGIDTRNSQIPITFTVHNLPTIETVRPTIFANVTSMLIVGPDRIISTVL